MSAVASRLRVPRRRQLRRPDLAGVAIVLGITVYFWARVVHLFPEVEFIDWIASPARATTQASIEAMVKFTDDAFSRHVALIWASLLGRACGEHIACINTMAYLPILGAVGSIYWLARLLGCSAVASTAVVTVWLVSEPMFSVLSWQATLLDRLATFFTPLTMGLIVLIVWRARTGILAIVLRAVGLCALALIAINTKEAAWILLPLAVLAPVLLARDLQQARLAALTLAAPVAVITVHIVTTLRAIDADPVTRQHVTSGSISDNLPVLTRYAVPGGLGVLIGLTALGLVCVAFAVSRRRTAPAAFALARNAVWVGVAAGGSWVIPLRTQYPSAFYMFLPLAMAALALALALTAGWAALPTTRRAAARRYGGFVVGVVLAAWFVGGAVINRWDIYGDWFRLDASFRGSIDRIAALRSAHPRDQIEFYVPPQLFSAYRFMTASPARDFWRFTSAETPEDSAYPITSQPSDCGFGQAIVIRLDAQLRPTGICRR
jgi:hypothetical protein